ncbi:MAG: KamA family radical SAM protein [Kiritimatiellae bacterium]|nr:KamA family radical SAM protein [Kiritimatiellia bacterium]
MKTGAVAKPAVKAQAATAPARRRALPPTPGRFASLDGLRTWLKVSRGERALWQDWRWQLRHALEAVDIARLGLLADEASMRAAVRYPVRVTPYFLSLVDWNDPADPIRRQWLPDGRELARLCSDAREDPFEEETRAPLPGLVHRFPDRVLIMAANACAMRCRHCTRKNTLGRMGVVGSREDLRRVLEHIAAHPEVHEAIVSGGDPLLLPDDRLLRLVGALAAMPQLDAIRIGTRVPAVLPMRVTDSLSRALGRFGKVWVNTQFNHARELTPAAGAACARLVEAGIPVSNQSVLLDGVNDTVEAMVDLCRGLQRLRVRPYYVFVCDPVTGTLHFRTAPRKARRIARELAAKIGGLALPRFVADLPGATAKVPI